MKKPIILLDTDMRMPEYIRYQLYKSAIKSGYDFCLEVKGTLILSQDLIEPSEVGIGGSDTVIEEQELLERLANLGYAPSLMV